MSNDLFGAVALVLVLGIGVVAFGPAYAGGAERVAASDEITVGYSGAQAVDESGLRYAETVTVTNASGATLRADIDYRWDATNGTVTFINTSATSSGETATVAYEYREPSQRQRTIAGVVSALGMPLVYLLFLLAGGYVFRELI